MDDGLNGNAGNHNLDFSSDFDIDHDIDNDHDYEYNKSSELHSLSSPRSLNNS